MARRDARWLLGRAVVPLLIVTCLAGCGTASPDSADKPAKPDAGAAGTRPDAGPPSTVASTTAAVADPAHAVPMPGPLTQQLSSSDILISQRTTISAAMIAAIEGIRVKGDKGVTAVEQLAVAQVPIEDQLTTVAAVDPATYRRFTPSASAETQAVWDRVAGGELAVVPEDETRLSTIAKDAYLKLGVGDDAPKLHIGAYAPQIDGAIDAVVNDKWGAALHMVPDNALIVSTGITSPEVVIKRIKSMVPAGVSVQDISAVGRYGLDPDAVQTAVLVGSVAEAVGTYTYHLAGDGRVTPDPAWVSSHIVTETVPLLGPVTCNKVIFPQLEAALREVIDRGLADKIHPGQYGGCYNARFIAGTTSLSNHAFGLAVDLNVPENERGTVGLIDRGVVQIFQKWGFTWGGSWHYTDPMHFEMNKIVNPG